MTFYVTEGGSGMLDPVAMGTAIQADLEAVGFDVTIETYEWNTFLGEVNPGLEGKADMAEMAWMTNDPTRCPTSRCAPRPGRRKGGFNSGYYSNPEVDALLEEARTATDQDRRAELYKRDAGDRAGGRALGLRRQLGAERGDQRPGRELR
jgi:peptide/nickel transport system substrate-binding protein